MHTHGSCWPQYYIKLNYATPEILFLTHFNNAHRINYKIMQRMKNAATWRNVKIHTHTHTIHIFIWHSWYYFVTFAWFLIYFIYDVCFSVVFFPIKIFENFCAFHMISKWFKTICGRSNFFIFKLTQISMHSSIAFKIRRQKL